MKKIISLLVCLCAFAAMAQQSLLNNLTNTTYAGLTTNTFIGAGFIGWNIDQTAVIQCTLVGTNANASNNVVLTFETSDIFVGKQQRYRNHNPAV